MSENISLQDREQLKEIFKQMIVERKSNMLNTLIKSKLSLQMLDIELNSHTNHKVLDNENHLFYPLAELYDQQGSLQPKYDTDPNFKKLKQKAFKAATLVWNWTNAASFDDDLQILRYKHHTWLAIYSVGQGELIINLYNLTNCEPELDAQFNKYNLRKISTTINHIITKLQSSKVSDS